MSTTKRGLFITFEGPDGCGKSTQLRLLAARLREAGQSVVETQEPGGTAIGNQIRRILLDPANKELGPTAELLLMFAARAQNVDQTILPALAQGQTVLADRFTDSSLVYQGVGRGLGRELVYDVDRIACRGLVPDLTLVVDIEVETGLARSMRRNDAAEHKETRFEEQSVGFHRQVRLAYQQLAAEESNRVHLIDGSGSKEQVAKLIWAAVQERL